MYAPKYRDLEVLQHENYQNIVGNFLKNYQFTDIIEIGTYSGGFTLFLRDTLPNCRIVTYDPFVCPDWLRNHGVDFRNRSPFSQNYEFISLELLKTIQMSTKLLVMVDGGNKVEEFKAISPLLRVGDHMMCHDYAPTVEVFQNQYKGVVWDHCEIFEHNIDSVCKTYNLHTCNPELNSVLWQCKVKVK